MLIVSELLKITTDLDALAWYGGHFPFDILLVTLLTWPLRLLAERGAQDLRRTKGFARRALLGISLMPVESRNTWQIPATL